jgi:hypothetical protein
VYRTTRHTRPTKIALGQGIKLTIVVDLISIIQTNSVAKSIRFLNRLLEIMVLSQINFCKGGLQQALLHIHIENINSNVQSRRQLKFSSH